MSGTRRGRGTRDDCSAVFKDAVSVDCSQSAELYTMLEDSLVVTIFSYTSSMPIMTLFSPSSTVVAYEKPQRPPLIGCNRMTMLGSPSTRLRSCCRPSSSICIATLAYTVSHSSKYQTDSISSPSPRHSSILDGPKHSRSTLLGRMIRPLRPAQLHVLTS